jgi:hypothetical protein
VANKPFEHDDPMQLRGVALPGDTSEAMAEAFVEEFIRMGYPDAAVLKVFSNPFYLGPHRVWTERGEAYVRELIGRVRSIWGRPRFRTIDSEVDHG